MCVCVCVCVCVCARDLIKIFKTNIYKIVIFLRMRFRSEATRKIRQEHEQLSRAIIVLAGDNCARLEALKEKDKVWKDVGLFLENSVSCT